MTSPPLESHTPLHEDDDIVDINTGSHFLQHLAVALVALSIISACVGWITHLSHNRDDSHDDNAQHSLSTPDTVVSSGDVRLGPAASFPGQVSTDVVTGLTYGVNRDGLIITAQPVSRQGDSPIGIRFDCAVVQFHNATGSPRRVPMGDWGIMAPGGATRNATIMQQVPSSGVAPGGDLDLTVCAQSDDRSDPVSSAVVLSDMMTRTNRIIWVPQDHMLSER